MAILDVFGLGGAINKVLKLGDVESAKAQAALKKLLDNPVAAMEKTLDVFHSSAPRDHHATALQLVDKLLQNDTIAPLANAFLTLPDEVQNQLANILNTNKNIDPHVLLPYLCKYFPIDTSKQFLIAHQHRFETARLLKLVVKIDQAMLEPVFDLIKTKLDNTALIGAIALVNSKSTAIRQQAIDIIAQFNNVLAQETLIKLQNDTEPSIRLLALKYLVKNHANLPAHHLLRLMRKARGEEQALLCQLFRHSNDSKMIPMLVDLLFSKDDRLQSHAVSGLNEIMSAEVLGVVLTALKSKFTSVKNQVIQLFTDKQNPRFFAAAYQLIDHEDADVRYLAASAFQGQDVQKNQIIKGMSKALGSDIPIELKREYIQLFGKHRLKKTINSLIQVLRSPYPDLYLDALNAINQLADTRAMSEVFKMVFNNQPEVQKAALHCLPAVMTANHAEQIRDRLLKQLDHFDQAMAEETIDTLETLTVQYQLKPNAEYEKALKKQATATQNLEQDFDLDQYFSKASQPAQTQDTTAMLSGYYLNDNNVFGVANTTPDQTGADARQKTDFAIDLKPGLVLNNRYELIREIGRGGYGCVWLILDRFIGEELALKFLHPQLVSDEVAIERFIRELRIARKITHPNIIRLFDYLDLGNVSAISMEYFNGQPLSSRIQSPFSPNTVCQITMTCCHALQAAHDVNIIHRDIKPSNILINENNDIKIVDFGIAAASKHAESRLTRTGTLVGTPTYISPEQIQGKNIDERTDIYSLGIIMYEMLSGHPPYQADNSMSLIFLHMEGKPEPLNTLDSSIPSDLTQIVHRCIRPKPQDRFQSMLELAQSLKIIQTR